MLATRESLLANEQVHGLAQFVTLVTVLCTQDKWDKAGVHVTNLMNQQVAYQRVIHSSQVMCVIYGFADALGNGFGSTLTAPEGVHYLYGLWGWDPSHQTSNYRELRNLVDMVDLELQDQPAQASSQEVGEMISMGKT